MSFRSVIDFRIAISYDGSAISCEGSAISYKGSVLFHMMAAHLQTMSCTQTTSRMNLATILEIYV